MVRYKYIRHHPMEWILKSTLTWRKVKDLRGRYISVKYLEVVQEVCIMVWQSKHTIFFVILTPKIAQGSWRPRRPLRPTSHSPQHLSCFLKAKCKVSAFQLKNKRIPMNCVVVSTFWTSGRLKKELNEISEKLWTFGPLRNDFRNFPTFEKSAGNSKIP